MAEIETNQRGRQVNREINMIPFIDLLMVTIAFLLIAAVWVTHSRLSATAQVPGGDGLALSVERVMHVHANEDDFALVWKHGAITVSETRVPRVPVRDDAGLRYPDLAEAIGEDWKRFGVHSDSHDARRDQCVIHSDDRLPFSEIVGLMDAASQAKRQVVVHGETHKVPVFSMSFAVR